VCSFAVAIALWGFGAGPPEAVSIKGTASVTLRGAAQADRSGVVIFVSDQPLAAGARPDASLAQNHTQFDPQVLVVPVGTKVQFPNLDAVEHNVFSRSPHATFDLGRYGRGGSKSVVFDQPGVVDIYCNVHPSMIGHVVVVPGPWAVTAADGSFAISGVSPGHHDLVVWARLGSPAITRLAVDVPEHGAATLDVTVVQGDDHEPPHPNKYGGAYRGPGY
jgi:plastocyanin